MRKHFHILLTGLAVCLGLFVLCVSALHAEASTYEDDISYMSFTYTDLRTGQKETFSLPNGKPTVVIYGGVGSCGNTNNFIYNVCSGFYDFSDFELYVFDIKDNTAETILGQMEGVDSRVHVSTINSCQGSSLYSFLGKYRKGNTMPFVAFIDANGILREFSEAYTPLADIDVRMRSIGVPSTYLDSVFDLPLEVKYCQTEARTELEMINAFRTGDNAWVWNEDDSEKIWYTDLEPLTYDYELEKVAMKRAAEIALYYSHYREDDKSCFDTYTDLGYPLYGAGENIAAGYMTARTVFTAWQEEDEPYDGQGHRRNILDSDYVSVGVGCVYYAGYYYWVQEFSSVNAGPESTEPAENSEVVTVKASYDYMEKMALDKDALEMEVFQHGPITDYVKVQIVNRYYSFSPQHASRPTMLVLPFQSSNEEVVRFENGEITAYGPGTAELTAALYNGAFTFKLTVTVTGCRHDYHITYDWSDDLSQVTAEALCQKCGDHIKETVPTKLSEILPTCEQAGYTAYVATFASEVFETQERITDSSGAPATGHRWGTPAYEWTKDCRSVTATVACQNDPSHIITETVSTTSKVTKEAGCETKGETTYTASFDNELFEAQTKTVENIAAAGHDWDVDDVKWIGNSTNGYTGAIWYFVCSRDSSHTLSVQGDVTSETNGDRTTYTSIVTLGRWTYRTSTTIKTPTDPSYPPGPNDPVKPDDPEESSVTRIFGSTRYQTSLKAALKLKELLGVEKFRSVVLTTGENFADALSGSYLANLNGAPVLLIKGSSKVRSDVQNFIKENVYSGGIVYILGGTQAVPDEWLGDLASSYDVRRIAGSTRYLTNLKILNESGFTGGDILVCTGTSFADSLSASAVPIPILLVNGSKSLNKDQKQYLASFNKNLNFIIIGGPSAVSASFENELARYGTVKTRIAGNNRYQTSTMIAQYFFPSAEHAVLAYGQNYPDGLSGGALAYALNCPLILADSTNARSKNAVSYCSGRNITDGLVLGGSKLITDDYVRKIFSMSTDAVILTQ